WRPDRAMYRGHETIVGMWRHHTQVNGWSDIAQHISIAPDGSIWLGRNWNMPPASAAGHNGNRDAGPFMFEMIGDFDRGRDAFDGEQKKTALDVIARVQMRFGLPAGTLQFHNMMSSKSCPGTSIDYHAVLQEVAELQTELHKTIAAPRDVAPADRALSPAEAASFQAVLEASEDLLRPTGRALEPADAEPCVHANRHHGAGGDGSAARDTGQRGFTPGELQALRPHVVNLRQGEFSASGDWTTSAMDVDAMFEHLEQALVQARGEGRKLQLMMYAHGGLTSEEAALRSAQQHLGWWRGNGIYPIYFIWETGLGEVLGQMLEAARRRAAPVARNFFSDHVGDPLVEAFVRQAGAMQIWGAMKASAQRASQQNVLGGDPAAPNGRPGGAFYVAQKLARFCQAHSGDVEVHAAGHSAGAIFHAYFVPCALAAGVPRFQSMHLLAPAVRTDVFHQQLAGHVGAGIAALTMYTMQDTFEKNDHCAHVYRKSLLYLVHKVLEPERDEPILGLERSVRADPALRTLFGTGTGTGAAPASIVWSVTAAGQGRSASQSTEHGGFDDDPATLGSVARRVLGKQDADRIEEYAPPASARGTALWEPAALPEWMEEYAPAVAPPHSQHGALTDGATNYQAAMQPAPGSNRPTVAGGAGRRVALCVGIDTYPTAPLGGCVNDAQAWSAALGRLGFRPSLLLNEQATRAAIVDALRGLVAGSRQGDVLVFQYAGHGTQVPDLDGDELSQDTAGQDEAMCPYDFATGELLIDDDLRAIFSAVPQGVNLTCFFDCCHSGTITRMALGAAPGTLATPGKRARFVQADSQLVARYTRRRSAAGIGAGSTTMRATGPASAQPMSEVVFSACLSSEVALENNGHGDFTRHALGVLGAGVNGMSNAAFAECVTRAFGARPAQHAKLYAAAAAEQLPLLDPAGAAMPSGDGEPGKRGTLASWSRPAYA
ncbi:MAG TPA: caspase family protein, partial [Pseudoduganella sp.]